MEKFNNSIKEFVEPHSYDVSISKDNEIVSLCLDSYDLENVNLFTFIRRGYTVMIKLSSQNGKVQNP